LATNVIPNDYRTHVGFELVTDINTSPENTYYMFLGNHVTEASVATLNDCVRDTLIDAYRNMIYAKKVSSSDVSMMIRNIPWETGTVYDQYDDTDTSQATDSYYAIVNAGAFYHVWKCLDNNQQANSTVTPDVSQISSDDTYYRTGDGYLWKYMASVDASTAIKFRTDNYFPITANAEVTAAAVPGAIDHIYISNTGSGYQNWLTGTFAAGDVRVNGNTVIYAVTGNSVSSQIGGFYSGCNLYIASGSGIGQYRTIIDYQSNANGNFIIIDTPFSTPPQNGSGYQIYPTVSITGQGTQTINAVARALINAVGNTVYRVDMLVRGAGYSYLSANVIANTVAAPTYEASLRPIYAPFNGHGFNVYEELGATRVSFSVKFSNNESNTIPATNQYQQVGILKNPLFANVVINFSSMYGTFLGNEQVYTYTTRLLQNNAVIMPGSANVTITNGVLTDQISSGDSIVFTTTENQQWYTTVNVVSNDTFMTISSSPSWACTAAQMYLAIPGTGEGTVVNLPGSNTVELSDVTGSFSTGSLVIGLNSGAQGVTNNVSRAGVVKGFNTFIGMDKFVATQQTGTFQQNEVLYMNFGGTSVNGATSAASIFDATLDSGSWTIYTSNTVGAFSEDPTNQIKGANSGATAAITAKYQPEIQFGSSKVLYLENIAAVARSNTLTDSINIILEF
jgi:hypothetical protein